MKYLAIVLVLLAVVGVYVVTSSNRNKYQSTAISTPSPTSSSQARQIQVEAGSYYYTPNTMTVKKGQPVKIIMTSVSMMHDFNIDELNVHMPIVQNGDTGEIEFTPDKTGTFQYYCSVGNHRAMGQVGTLTVTD